MDPHQLEQIKEAVREGIETNVNGKIRTLTVKFEEYVKEDMAWKKKYEPYLEGLASVSVAVKLLVTLAIGLGAITGVLLKFKKLFW